MQQLGTWPRLPRDPVPVPVVHRMSAGDVGALAAFALDDPFVLEDFCHHAMDVAIDLIGEVHPPSKRTTLGFGLADALLLSRHLNLLV